MRSQTTIENFYKHSALAAFCGLVIIILSYFAGYWSGIRNEQANWEIPSFKVSDLASIPPALCPVDLTTDPKDADTLKGRIHLPFAGITITGPKFTGVSIRSDYDAWETSKSRGQRMPFKEFTQEQWDEEFRKGKKARDELIEALKHYKLFVAPIPPEEDIDPYERIDAYWYFWDPVTKKLMRVKDYAQEKGWLRSNESPSNSSFGIRCWSPFDRTRVEVCPSAWPSLCC